MVTFSPFAIESHYWNIFYRLFVETPRMGSRLLQTADEELLELAKKREWWHFFDLPHLTDFVEVKIPVIVILTKYDLLVMEHYRSCSRQLSVRDKKVEAPKRAKLAFNEVTKHLKVPFAPVTTFREAMKEYGGLLIISVTISLSLK